MLNQLQRVPRISVNSQLDQIRPVLRRQRNVALCLRFIGNENGNAKTCHKQLGLEDHTRFYSRFGTMLPIPSSPLVFISEFPLLAPTAY
jgi:hypothetical protein